MGLSRNKVAVPEGAAGSPPFYGVFQDAGLASVVWPMRRGWFPGSCGRAGVEEIVGFAGPWGRRGAVRICFWVPGPPPASVLGACGFPDAPGGTPSALRAAGRVRSGRVVV